MKTIDIHAHWFPPEWVRLMERDAGRFGGSLARTPKGYKVSAGALTNVFTDEFVDIDRRLAGMDRTGVALQLLSLTSPMVYWAPGEFGLALAQAFNDAASAAHRRHPARLLGAAMLPMQAPELALRSSSGRRSCPACARSTSRPTSTAPSSTTGRSGRSTRSARPWAGRSSCTRSTPSGASARSASTCATCSATPTTPAWPPRTSSSAACWTRFRGWR